MSQLKPWDRIGEPRVLAEDPYGKQFYEQQYRDPRNGKIHTFIHFSQRDWSVVLPITTDLQVITVIQYKQGCNQIVRELPAGTSDFRGEPPEDVMRRELKQETGYEAGAVYSLGEAQFIATRNSPTRFHPFLAFGCTKTGPARLDDVEDIETELLSLGDWFSLCLNDLVEPSAIVATFRALPIIKREFNINLIDLL